MVWSEQVREVAREPSSPTTPIPPSLHRLIQHGLIKLPPPAAPPVAPSAPAPPPGRGGKGKGKQKKQEPVCVCVCVCVCVFGGDTEEEAGVV